MNATMTVAGAEDVITELTGLLALLRETSEQEWGRPTRCAGWTVEDLARHVAGSPAVLNEGLRRMLEGIEEPADPGPMTLPDRASILTAIDAGCDETAALLATLHDSDLARSCPFPFGTVPLSFALHVLTFEYGGHRNDLAWALGHEMPFPPAVSRAAAAIVPVLAAELPAEPLAYVLSGDTVEVSLVAQDGSWQPGASATAPTCVITGDDSSIAMFATGRLPHDSPQLRITGAVGAAAQFKHYFPGP